MYKGNAIAFLSLGPLAVRAILITHIPLQYLFLFSLEQRIPPNMSDLERHIHIYMNPTATPLLHRSHTYTHHGILSLLSSLFSFSPL